MTVIISALVSFFVCLATLYVNRIHFLIQSKNQSTHAKLQIIIGEIKCIKEEFTHAREVQFDVSCNKMDNLSHHKLNRIATNIEYIYNHLKNMHDVSESSESKISTCLNKITDNSGTFFHSVKNSDKAKRWKNFLDDFESQMLAIANECKYKTLMDLENFQSLLPPLERKFIEWIRKLYDKLRKKNSGV